MKYSEKHSKIFLCIGILIISIILLPLYGVSNIYSDYSNGSIDNIIEKLNNEVPELMKKYKIAGASITIINDGKIEWTQGFGYADKSKGIKVTEDTVFQAASISKSATAIGVMKLVEEGKIDLNAPVKNYLTKWDFPASEYNSEAVTVKNLITHTGGLTFGGYAGYRSDAEIPSLLDSISGKAYKGNKVQIIEEPGTRFMYSGGGYSLLQLLIEEVTGMPYSEYMQKNVLDKLDMNSSSYEWNGDIKTKTSKAYGVFGEEIDNFIFAEKAAAGLYTSSKDLAKLCISMMKPEFHDLEAQELLSSETKETMLTPASLKNGNTLPCGLGFFIYEDESNNKRVFHGGDNRGWRSNINFMPENGSGIIIMTNSYFGIHLISDVMCYWDEAITGIMPANYYSARNLESRIKIISLFILAVLLILLIKAFVDLKKGKRRIAFMSKNDRVKAIIKLIFLIAVITVWWVGLYAPWYNNGWTIIAFLPWGLDFLSKMITIYIVIFIALAFLSKKKRVKKTKEKR